MTLTGSLHEKLVFGRRTQALAGHLEALLPEGAHVLDVGCGDGTIDRLILQDRPDLRVEGIDILVRPETHIPVTRYDGETIPFADKSVDVVQFVDVLHHTNNQEQLLAEAARVARKAVILKDHLSENSLDFQTLRFMDWVGNRHHGVVLPYNYWSEARWREAFARCGLAVERWTTDVGLYPWPASLFFDRRLHMVTRLRVEG